ncbi:putative dehydrogenase/reductase SDR family protein 7-like [Apostichopus japonicus]|uniref:Putative dehydrogenase/reductase SDR family protein 7-like n=1 Tax=Stichopus japonicus TaxID=307972 RepID=A0A2G8KUC5_STIJA|nr:putative dehydrogenase/reductase SDR family protein 7-like [Apostichopus japonicus]
MLSVQQHLTSTPSVLTAAVFGGLGLLWLYRRLTKRQAIASLRDKVVLITGASSGIGEACAHAFHKAGCRVIISARRLEELERVKKDVISRTVEGQSHEPQVIQMDVTDFASIPDKIQTALSYHGRIDILINNAGLSYRGSALETKIEVYQKLMLVNYFGCVAVTSAVLPSMIGNKGGSIIAVSSVQGKIGLPYRTAYSASKFAVQSYFDCLRAEVAEHNIHIGIISPSYVQTNLSMNAVCADNSQHGKLDSTTAKGMTPEYLADRIVLQTALGEADVVVGPFLHCIGGTINVLFPAWIRMVMRKRAKKGMTAED